MSGRSTPHVVRSYLRWRNPLACPGGTPGVLDGRNKSFGCTNMTIRRGYGTGRPTATTPFPKLRRGAQTRTVPYTFRGDTQKGRPRNRLYWRAFRLALRRNSSSSARRRCRNGLSGRSSLRRASALDSTSGVKALPEKSVRQLWAICCSVSTRKPQENNSIRRASFLSRHASRIKPPRVASSEDPECALAASRRMDRLSTAMLSRWDAWRRFWWRRTKPSGGLGHSICSGRRTTEAGHSNSRHPNPCGTASIAAGKLND